MDDNVCAGSRAVGAGSMAPNDAAIEFAVRNALQPDQVSCELDAARATWNLRRDPRGLRKRLLQIVASLDDEQS